MSLGTIICPPIIVSVKSQSYLLQVRSSFLIIALKIFIFVFDFQQADSDISRCDLLCIYAAWHLPRFFNEWVVVIVFN